MKRKIVLLVVIGLILTIPNGTIFGVNSKASALSCEITQFGLSNINIDKTWTNLGCYATFDEAKIAMTEQKATYNDLVITHDGSFSPLKIIAASRAIAASYPFRNGGATGNNVTVDMFRNSNLTGESTYMVYHLDMAYYETVSFNPTTGTGSAKVQISGFVGYIQLLQIDIIPLIYIENGWDITLGGKTYLEVVKGQTGQEQPFSLKPRMNEYRVSTNTSKNVQELFHQTFSLYDGRSYGTYVVGRAPDWLPNGTYYSWDGIHFFTDRAMTQPVMNKDVIGEYYNYYLYLPLRSSSNYTAADLDAYLNSKTLVNNSVMKNEGKAFVDAQNKYGMNALLVYALAIHESGHGTSSIAKTKNNLFGWGAVDSNPSDAYLFASISQSVSEHMGKNLRGYLSIENWRYFGQAYANKNSGLATKYASDPYWGNKIAGHAYSIDRFHDFKDYGQYSIGILNKGAEVAVKKEAKTSSANLFTMKASLQNQSVLITNSFKDGDNTVYEIMSPMPVSGGNIIRFNETASQLVEYDWQQSKGYLINEPMIIAYNGIGYPNMPNVINQALLAKPALAKTNSIQFQDGKLTITGYHVKQGLSVSVPSQLVHELTLIDPEGKATVFPLITTTDASLAALTNDGRYNVSNMGFSGTLNLSAIIPGVYTFQLKSTANVSRTPIVYSSELKINIIEATGAPEGPIEPEVLLGDVNGDGRVSITDLVILHSCLSGFDDITKYNSGNADMNQDGRLSITDLVILHAKLSGL